MVERVDEVVLYTWAFESLVLKNVVHSFPMIRQSLDVPIDRQDPQEIGRDRRHV